MNRSIAVLASLVCLAAVPAAGQTSPSGTGPAMSSPGPNVPSNPTQASGPGDRTGSVASTGQTKPPGAAADGAQPDLEKKSKELDQKINRGICTGC